MAEKPYLRKMEPVNGFDVWEVDGNYIRNNIDREFTNFGEHYRFSFIPIHEFWIDKEFGNDEHKYFIDHMIIEWNLCREGKSYNFALKKADEAELKERKKSALMKKVTEEMKELPKNAVPKEVYKEKLAENEGVLVWLVNGELVRDLYFIDFTEGGHHFVYNFVPYNEVWIDNDLSPKERYFVLLHELHERYLMHTGLTYTKAHYSSSIIEYKCRREPALLQDCLNEEIEKNKMVVKHAEVVELNKN